MLEKDVEKYLVRQIKTIIPKALCLKLVSPGFAGVPDRIILLPGAKVVFAELKKPGKKPRKLQKYIHGLIRNLGFPLFGCVDSKMAADQVVRHCYALVCDRYATVADDAQEEKEGKGATREDGSE